MEKPTENAIEVSHLTMGYDGRTIMRDISFDVRKGEAFLVIGPSGCGKSTLLRHLVGLAEPVEGRIRLLGEEFLEMDFASRQRFMRRIGILYQAGALWSSMTIAENIALPLQLHTTLSDAEIRDVCICKLELVGLAGFQDFYPSQLSGGMQKRAGLARALALDPEILFFDEPSAGLDPVTARNLDRLIVELRDTLGSTLVIVTHDLDSIFAVGTEAIYLDPKTCSILGQGAPRELLENPPAPEIADFLARTPRRENQEK